MTTTEILHKIVETESKAKSIYDAAIAMQTDFDENVRASVSELKNKYAAREERDVAAAESEAVGQANIEIIRLDRKLEADLAAAKRRYESHKASYVDKLFKLAVNIDA